MAIIGLRHPVAAPITAENTGAEPTYGTGFVIGHGIQADVTYNTRDNPLYGDDVTIENDKGITDADVNLEVDDLEDAVRQGLLGEEGNTSQEYMLKDKNPPYVGFGYLRVKMKNNVKKYEAFWLYKAQFSIASDSATTKRQNIEWGTPTLNGKGFAIDVDGTGEPAVRKRKVFETEATGIAWLDALANITAATTGGNTTGGNTTGGN